MIIRELKAMAPVMRVLITLVILLLSTSICLAEPASSTVDEGKDVSEGPQGKLVILTSYPKQLTDEFRRAFERKHPTVEVEVVKKKTGAGIKHLKNSSEQNLTDIYWVSAPAAMEMLKVDGLLEKFVPNAPGLPKYVSSYPINDKDGFYSGFAASGYGVMWNERYLQAKKLDQPSDWEVLAKPEFFGHVGMSSPSRSGTTHLAVEAILQSYGWSKGWELIQGIGGNLSEVTQKSAHVPRGVETGKFGAGVVIDYYGLGSRARRYPVNFAYPEHTTIVPANVALVKNAPNPTAAKAFIEFLLTDQAQTLLLSDNIRRLPVRPEIYNRASDDFPNPFQDKALQNKLKFDVVTSRDRYPLVNSLFDVLVTYNLDNLQAATSLLHLARAKLADSPKEARDSVAPLILQAEALVNYIPVTESDSKNKELVSIFKKKRKKATDKLEGQQAELELGWQEQVKSNYQQAGELAALALAKLEGVGISKKLSLAPVDK